MAKTKKQSEKIGLSDKWAKENLGLSSIGLCSR